jgi:hypothetical protein
MSSNAITSVEEGATETDGQTPSDLDDDPDAVGPGAASSGPDSPAPDSQDPDRHDAGGPDAAGPEADPVELTLDEIFELLKNERRRRVLAHLGDRDDPMRLGELADVIAARENDKPVGAVTSTERKRVYVGLYQCHLPKLDSMGVVDFAQARGRVELSANAERLEPYLDRSLSNARPWPVYYAAIASGGVVPYAAGVLGVLPTAPTVAVTLGVVLLALSACSLVHARAVRGEADD